MTSARAQRAIERVGEDEALTGDLADPAATALLGWVTDQIAAADEVRDDAAFSDRVSAIRSAAKAAARAGADAPDAVVERASAILRGDVDRVSPAAPTRSDTADRVSTPPAAPTADPTALLGLHPAPAPTPDQPQPQPPTSAPRPRWGSLRRLQRWIHRKDRA